MRRAAVKSARQAFDSQDRIEAEWRGLGYLAPPSLEAAIEESDAYLGLLERLGVELVKLSSDDATGLDSIYARDAAVVCDGGLVLCRMGKPARRPEAPALGRVLETAGVPILGKIEGEGTLEGGDVVWLGPRTLAVGRGYRSNSEGIRQLRELLEGHVDELLVVDLPHWRGPDDVFHLMSMLSPVDTHLAVAYSPLMPVSFRASLIDRGIELVEVPDEEFDSMGANVLAVGGRGCVMLEGNPVTRQRLEAAGADVHVFEGAEISSKGCGGPTCLTLPIHRG